MIRRPLLAVLGSIAGLAQAAEPEEEVEVEDDVGSAYEILVVAPDGSARVAGSAHVVPASELDRYAYIDISNTLAKVPGVTVRGEDGFGLRPNIGMRGGNSDRSAKITLLEDGIPMSPAAYAAPAAYYFPLSTRLVGVEVFKGPASIRQGPQTIGGAVNVWTRPVPDGPEGLIDVAAGQRDTVKVHGWTGTRNERLGILIEGAHLSSGGFKELDTGGPTGFLRQDVLMKLRGDFGEQAAREQSLEVKLGYGREASDETYLGLSLDDFEATPYRRYAASDLDHMTWQHSQASLSWNARFGDFDVRAVAWHAYLARAWTKFNAFAGGPDVHDLLLGDGVGQDAVFVGVLEGSLDTASPDQELRIGTNDRLFHSGGLITSVRHRVGFRRKIGNELDIGLRLHADEVSRLHTEDPYAMVSGRPIPTGGPTETTLDSRSRARALATYVHDDLRLRDLHVVPGARLELIRTAAGTGETGPVDPADQVALLPGLGLFLEALPWLDVLAGVHRGFSPVAPGSAPEIRPETAWSWEAGARLAAGETQLEAIGFWSDYDNVVGQCTLSGGCTDGQVDRQFNGGSATVLGVETLASHRIGLPKHFGLFGSASYTATLSAFQTGFVSEFPQFGAVEAGDALPYVPAHQGAASIGVDHPLGELALSTTARSEMRDVAGQGTIPTTERIPGGVRLDLASTLRASDTVSGYFNITNLTNAVWLESFRPYGARPSAPFQLMVGVKISPGGA